jgi:hypothetical protein
MTTLVTGRTTAKNLLTVFIYLIIIIIIIIIIIKEIKNSHIVHYTHTTESANVKAQNISHGRYNITCSTNCNYRTAVTLCTLGTWFVSGT